jgi:CAAX protease family protein
VIRDRPVTSFLLITFGISYALGIPFNVAVSSLVDSSTLAGLYLPRLVTVIGPAVAALLVARAGHGVISVAQLLGSLRLRAGDLRWVAPVAAVGVISAAVAFVLAGVPLEELLAGVATWTPLLFGHVLIQVVLIGVGEELGWRGWLLPTLSAHRSFRVATALTGLAWGLWHLPIFFSGLSVALSFTVLVASLSLSFSWLWHRTGGGTGVVAVAHGFVNAPFFFVEQLVRPMPDGDALIVRALACFAWSYSVIALALFVTSRDIWRVIIIPCGSRRRSSDRRPS